MASCISTITSTSIKREEANELLITKNHASIPSASKIFSRNEQFMGLSVLFYHL